MTISPQSGKMEKERVITSYSIHYTKLYEVVDRWKVEVAGVLPQSDMATSSNELPEEYLAPAIDPEVLSYFAPEADEYLHTLVV